MKPGQSIGRSYAALRQTSRGQLLKIAERAIDLPNEMLEAVVGDFMQVPLLDDGNPAM